MGAHRYTIFIMAGAAVLLMFPRYPMLYSAYQFLLMGYYLIVALREEVGSRFILCFPSQDAWFFDLLAFCDDKIVARLL